MKPQESNQLIYEGTLVSVGQFRRTPDHPDFRGPHEIGGTLMVFPRTSVTIAHAGRAPVVADVNTVMFYNDRQIYSREKLSEKGDLCEWFRVDARLAADALRSFDAHVDDHPAQPFRLSHGPCDTKSYVLQRLVVNYILGDQQPDTLFIEETVMQILNRVIENYYRQLGVQPRKAQKAQEREIVDAIQKILATCFEHSPSLEEIATELNYSPFHLCRIFRKYRGQSIRQYLNELRLRTSLEYVMQGSIDLTSLALKLGFASHSHFTEAFRKTFGQAPSLLRKTSERSRQELLSKISIA